MQDDYDERKFEYDFSRLVCSLSTVCTEILANPKHVAITVEFSVVAARNALVQMTKFVPKIKRVTPVIVTASLICCLRYMKIYSSLEPTFRERLGLVYKVQQDVLLDKMINAIWKLVNQINEKDINKVFCGTSYVLYYYWQRINEFILATDDDIRKFREISYYHTIIFVSKDCYSKTNALLAAKICLMMTFHLLGIEPFNFNFEAVGIKSSDIVEYDLLFLHYVYPGKFFTQLIREFNSDPNLIIAYLRGQILTK
jgi:hypothetical protein